MGLVQFISPRIGGDWSMSCRNHQPISLLKMARIWNVPLPVHCQKGLCGTCVVRVTPQGKQQQLCLNAFEKETLQCLGKLPAMLASEGQKPWKGPYWRLACQCIVGTSDQFFVAF